MRALYTMIDKCFKCDGSGKIKTFDLKEITQFISWNWTDCEHCGGIGAIDYVRVKSIQLKPFKIKKKPKKK